MPIPKLRNLFPWPGQPTHTDPAHLVDRRDGIIAAEAYLRDRNRERSSPVVLFIILGWIAVAVFGLWITR